MADSGSDAAGAAHRHRTRAGAGPVRQAAGGLPGRQVRRRGRLRRRARTSRTREVHHLPPGIVTGRGAFGGCPGSQVQGGRHRTAGAAHLASVARRPGLLRRVRRQRARPAHPTADPVAAECRCARAAADPRRPRRPPGDAVFGAGNGMSRAGSLESGVTPNPLDEGIPFGAKLAELADRRGDDTAVTVVGLDGNAHSLTFGELDARANQWGRALAAEGAQTGSLVALAIPNSQHLILAALGCWKIGAVPVPMHWDLPEWERNRVREVIVPAVVVDERSRWELEARAAGESESPLPAAVSPHANGICSSGSTGVPKVILSLAPSLWIPQQGEPFMSNWTPVAQPQTIMVPAPMYHTNGFATFLYLLAGDHLVVLEKFDAALVLDVIERYRITNFTATPTMLARIAARPDVRQRDFSSVVFILQGAAVMPAPLLHTWFELLSPEQIVMAYGMTENLGLTALRGDEWLAHPGSVGRGFRDTEIRILDAEKRPLGPGQVGDVYLRAPMSAGYRYLGGAPPLPSTDDGFRSAGDMGHLDADGYLYIIDRRVDMIITGGANVFPSEVESALAGHPGIADVVVIGLSDPQWGRRVHAVVQLADPNGRDPLTEQQVIEYAKSRLAPYKAPKTVEFVDAIPRTAATKVNRSAMIAARGG